MVQVSWSPRALRELADIRDHIGMERPLAAQRMAFRLREAAESLAVLPNRGRKVRELPVIYPYVIRYEVRDDCVRIIRIKHGAQRPG